MHVRIMISMKSGRRVTGAFPVLVNRKTIVATGPSCGSMKSARKAGEKLLADHKAAGSPRVFDDCGREALELADLRITVRMGKDLNGQRTLYMGKASNGAELDQRDVERLVPFLRRFARTGKLKPVKRSSNQD